MDGRRGRGGGGSRDSCMCFQGSRFKLIILPHLELKIDKILQRGINCMSQVHALHLRPHSIFRDDDVSGVAKNHETPIDRETRPKREQPTDEILPNVDAKSRNMYYDKEITEVENS